MLNFDSLALFRHESHVKSCQICFFSLLLLAISNGHLLAMASNGHGFACVLSWLSGKISNTDPPDPRES